MGINSMGSRINSLIKNTRGRNIRASRPSSSDAVFFSKTKKDDKRKGNIAIVITQKKNAEQRMEAATKEIIAFYKAGWPGLSALEKQTITALALALIRKKIVIQYASQSPLKSLLLALVKQGKISLPRRKGKIQRRH